MLKTTCIIIEDEKDNQCLLIHKIEKFFPQIEILKVLDHIEDAIHYLKGHEPSIIFLDIRLRGGSAFDILETLPKINSQIIYTTAFKDYAITALNHSATYYLLKPIKDDDFRTAVEKALSQLPSKPRDPKISLFVNGSYKKVRVSDIIYIISDGAYSKIVLANTNYLISKNIGSLEASLPKSFIRCHHSYLVNSDYFSDFSKNELKLKNGELIPVSSRKNKLIQCFFKNKDNN